ncbi:ubiquitin carboxyl-terminal hydrolase 18-like [Dorcoceras hygrometricum]|uniref:Ubiquitin carboxyl-terminal hydrolase 18-like n=1 Tax=Dorcoceras hygrometricum TaxID=472368 RepID=A0A2Z7BBA3_9LAMI|nr:ubiquitin carboxyl-terminal hydrolase 18-like [Dorcoceras hygrometricum]
MANQIKRRNVSSLTYENFPGGHPSQYCSHPCTLNSTHAICSVKSQVAIAQCSRKKAVKKCTLQFVYGSSVLNLLHLPFFTHEGSTRKCSNICSDELTQIARDLCGHQDL